MYVVMNRVMVNSGWEDEFETRFKKRSGEINKVTGFVSMQILKPDAANLPFIVLTHWQDKTAFEAWVHSDDFKLAHQNPMPKEAFSEGGGLESFNVVISA
ncbi:MAG: antibiotic biosynthesis monooxygenase [Gammaproteobacteria bacterium]|nr:antibiotic biosynthesis monooxygenase [Gammaproteobacteria bacterium]